MTFHRSLILAALAAMSLASLAWPQGSRATLQGRVTDAQGAVVPDASIVVTSDGTGVKQTTKANSQGNWIVQFLLPGEYSISITAAGFKQLDRHGVTLQTGDAKQIDSQLELGATNTQVTVV